MKRRIVLIGPPASGKGTLADRLQSEKALSTVSPGNLLRAEKTAGTELGKRADEQTRYGRLVDDDTINSIVGNWLRFNGTGGFVLDGYPRTIGQAAALNGILASAGTPLDCVLLLDAPTEMLADRISRRAICSKCGNIVSVGLHIPSFDSPCPRCGGPMVRRADDTVETLRQRLVEYEAKTAPLIQFYTERNLLARIDAKCSVDQVYQQAERKLA